MWDPVLAVVRPQGRAWMSRFSRRSVILLFVIISLMILGVVVALRPVEQPLVIYCCQSTTNRLTVFVFDDRARPVEGVQVRLEGPTPKTALTDVSGAAVFSGLDYGTYLVYATKQGYRAASPVSWVVTSGGY